MLDIRDIRENSDYVIERLAARGKDARDEVAQILSLDGRRRAEIQNTEQLKAKQNQATKQVPVLKKEGKDPAALMAEMKVLSEEIKQSSAVLKAIEDELEQVMLGLPNLPDPDLASGEKENNQVIRTHLAPPAFDFTPKHHVDLCTDLGLIDYERGVKLSGSGYWIYRGLGARIEWALLNYFIDTHLADGYELILPPHMLGYEAGLTAGQFPKFTEDVYWIESDEGRKHFMLPTAETALVSLHRDEILREEDLPKKYIAYTPCYRREAGSYRAEERGMIRGHQFNKVEMVQYTTPEGSDAAFEELVGKAESLMKGLGLHFNTVKLAAGDCSASMARTYDIEVYIPSMGYKEVSSASNARTYQARRGGMRFKRAEGGKAEFLHTLNASGLATSRLLPAIVEQYQQADGSVVVPEILRKYLGGIDRIR